MEVVYHDVNGKVIVYSAIVYQRRIYLDRLEHTGKTHGGTDGITQIALVKNHRFLVVYVRRDTAERNKKLVKVVVACSRSLSEQLEKGKIHLQRVYYARRQELRLYLVQWIFQRNADVEKFGSRRISFEVIDVFFFNIPGVPAFEVVRLEQLFHIVGRIPHGIE